jgi:hypothetical protein
MRMAHLASARKNGDRHALCREVARRLMVLQNTFERAGGEGADTGAGGVRLRTGKCTGQGVGSFTDLGPGVRRRWRTSERRI